MRTLGKNSYLVLATAAMLTLSVSQSSYALRKEAFASSDKPTCEGTDPATDNASLCGDDAGAALIYRFNEAASTPALPSAAESVNLTLQSVNEGTIPTEKPIGIKSSSDGKKLIINRANNTGGDAMTLDMGYTHVQAEKNLLVSAGAATAINTCSDFTVQLFARPWFPMQGNNNNGNMIGRNGVAGNLIVGLSNVAFDANGKPESNVSQNGTTFSVRSFSAPNWGIYQTGATGSERIGLQVRNPGPARSSMMESVSGAFSSVRQGDGVIAGEASYTEFIVSFKAPTATVRGELTIYVNRMPRTYQLTANINEANDNGTVNNPTVYYVNPQFLPTAYLVIGNERFSLATSTVSSMANQQWSGEIKHLAVYCSALPKADILGGRLPGEQSKLASVKPDLSKPISEYRRQAQKLVNRLTGIINPIDHPTVLKVEEKLAAGDRVGAAGLVINGDVGLEPNPAFLNILVKQFAIQMSNREETLRAPLNDFAASFIGVTRDGTNAKDLLTGDFYYVADPTKVVVRSNLVNDILLSNNHYSDLDNGDWDIGKVLMRIDKDRSEPVPRGFPVKMGQVILYGDPALQRVEPSPNPAGVLTSRAFLSSHAVAGTNRRMVEYSLRAFACLPMAEIADISASGARIGRDIDRTPGLDNSKFETNCKGCHTVMDGFRGVFAPWDFSTVMNGGRTYNYVRHAKVNTSTDGFGFALSQNASPQEQKSFAYNVVYKMNHNNTTFPTGFEITDDSFVNNAVGLKNRALFGWTGPNARGGFGATDFGRMLSDSARFSQCLSKRVYESVCLPPQGYDFNFVKDLIFKHASQFEKDNYKLKGLFQRIAADPQCVK